MSMYLPASDPLSDSCYFMSGDVRIAPGVGIAPGVLLQADPDSYIEIAAGVCIGMGSILHAHAGSLVIEGGATLGTGVLLIGRGHVGSHACIGSSSTIWNASVLPAQVVPPGSMVGDGSRPSPETSTDPPAKPLPVSPVAQVERISNDPPPPAPKSTSHVLGQAQLNRLLSKIYPFRQQLGLNEQDGIPDL
ncbi:MAG: carbon dioxide concentrating mechanism protein [Cyanobacteriota bacterium]|nr:carbon dioxide concentrating mechanism protein [Cyanobacteriota bacterium]